MRTGRVGNGKTKRASKINRWGQTNSCTDLSERDRVRFNWRIGSGLVRGTPSLLRFIRGLNPWSAIASFERPRPRDADIIDGVGPAMKQKEKEGEEEGRAFFTPSG